VSHTIIYNSEERLIEIKVQGDLSLNEVKEIMTEAAQTVKAQNCFLVLTDMREASLNVDMLEIYQLPKILTDIFASFELSAYKLKRALVVANGLKDYSFHENVASNRSQHVKYFVDRDEARKWLLGN
jgi:hypothetical protein